MNLVILGATARAAVWSALRAELVPFATDLFADQDLKAVARSVLVGRDQFPRSLVDAADTFPDAPWIYTGPLENHPELVDSLSRRRTLWGADAVTLSRVRDPIEVARVLRAAGLAVPEVQVGDPSGLPRDGSWLRKPIASAGGVGVRLHAADECATSAEYSQRLVSGENLAALFVGTKSLAALAGVTYQWLGRGDDPFVYRGSLGPVTLPAPVLERIHSLGEAIRVGFGLVGLFGVDLILDAAGTPWPVEINPRYTASVEVLELAHEVSLLDAHRSACMGEDLPSRLSAPSTCRRFVGKEVVYASGNCVFQHEIPIPVWDPAEPWRIPPHADLPAPGTHFRADDPVLTLLASGADLAACTENLAERRAMLGIGNPTRSQWPEGSRLALTWAVVSSSTP